MNLGFLHIIDKNRSFNLFSIFCLYIVYFLSLERCLHSCKAIYTTIDYISLETHWFFVFTIFYTTGSRIFYVRLLVVSILSFLYRVSIVCQTFFILYHVFTFFQQHSFLQNRFTPIFKGNSWFAVCILITLFIKCPQASLSLFTFFIGSVIILSILNEKLHYRLCRKSKICKDYTKTVARRFCS